MAVPLGSYLLQCFLKWKSFSPGNLTLDLFHQGHTAATRVGGHLSVPAGVIELIQPCGKRIALAFRQHSDRFLMASSVNPLSSPADCGHDPNLTPISDGSCQAAGVPRVFVIHKDVDVIANLSLLVRNAVANTGIHAPESRQCLGQSRRRAADFDFAAPRRELP